MKHDISGRQLWVDQVSNYMLKRYSSNTIVLGILALWALELDHKTYRYVVIVWTTDSSD